ncbi:MAG TPA: family 78 glycoside hydrolase catalytic domain, partial [Acidimicrobiales bacterium]|nr:family 78 glycoside hydrolase catalytic domain [Acidimicrobiales bacterium]
MTVERFDRRTFVGLGARAAVAAAVSSSAGVLVGDATAEASVTGSPGRPGTLRVNGLETAIGVDPDALFLAWTVSDPRRAAIQRGYRVRVFRPAGSGTGSRTVWDSGTVTSSRQAFVPYGGPRLSSDTEYGWAVSTQDRNGIWSPVSASTFVTGLRTSDWRAQWLRPGPGHPAPEHYTYLRTEKVLPPSRVVRATAYVAAAHKYQLWVNGRLADTGPSFSYPDESYYQASDITALVRAGEGNAIGLLHHWYGRGTGRPQSTPGILAQVSVHHADGSRRLIVTDGSVRQRAAEWLPAPPRNTEANDFVEIIDGRSTPVGWADAGYDDAHWEPVTVRGPAGTPPFTALFAQRTRIAEYAVAPVSLHRLRSGAVVVDFGKVYAARPIVRFDHGQPGRTVNVHAGYVLDADGHVSTTHAVQQTNMAFAYIQRGGSETFTPYTFLGFRYLEIDDPGESLRSGQVTAMARHAAMPAVAAASFSSSDPSLDAVWGLCTHSALYASHEQFVDTPTRQKGQYVSDGANESEAVMRAYGDQNMTWQALRDFARSQARFWPDGRINDVYPDGNGADDIPDFTELYPEWVWRYYQNTGDRTTVVGLYPVVLRLADYIWAAVDPSTGLVTNLPGGGTDYLNGLVDWPPESRYGYDMDTAARTTVNILGMNAIARVAQIAVLAGDGTGASAQATRATSLRNAINARLTRPDGVYIDGLRSGGAQSTHASQQANGLALCYGVVPSSSVAAVADFTASLGMALGPDHGMELLRGLHAAGRDADIAHILTDRTIPGWARILASGGTFTWEDWDPTDLDGDSMSHGWGSSALVAVQEALLGVALQDPKGEDDTTSLEVRPPAIGLSRASDLVPTAAGPVSAAWRRSDGTVTLSLSLPPNADAVVVLPGTSADRVLENGTPVTRVAG